MPTDRHFAPDRKTTGKVGGEHGQDSDSFCLVVVDRWNRGCWLRRRHEPRRRWMPPTAPPVCNRRGRLHRMFHHTAHTVQDKLIGYPENFAEPPLGHYINEQFAVQVAKADPHRFTLYHSDFLPGTSLFSPIGASRYNIMATRMPGWLGPITIEWTPEQPELAESRRQAIVETLLEGGPADPGGSRRRSRRRRTRARWGSRLPTTFRNAITRSQMSAQGIRPATGRVGLDGSSMT